MNYRKSIETTAELAAWYDEKYVEMGGAWYTPPEDCNRHLDVILEGRPAGGLLLDVGCGGGHFMEQAMLRGLSCIGLEISEEGRRLTHARVTTAIICAFSVEDNKWMDILRRSTGGLEYIASIGSLEHVIDLGAALDNIRELLRPDGRWYFYCPTTDWVHEDQPNERTATPEEWIALFLSHGLVTDWHKVYNDNVAVMGHRI